MLAVASPWRGLGIATALVRRAIDAMAALRADEVVLETEETNSAAMRLYERLGFLRSKKLHRYYLNGSSAYRLVLLLRSPLGGTESEGNDDEEELFDADEDLGERYADDSGDPMVGIGSGERSAGDHGPRRLTLEDDPARAAGRGRDGGGGGSEGGGAAGAGPMQSTGMVGA